MLLLPDLRHCGICGDLPHLRQFADTHNQFAALSVPQPAAQPQALNIF
jgi:hypothetical protein